MTENATWVSYVRDGDDFALYRHDGKGSPQGLGGTWNLVMSGHDPEWFLTENLRGRENVHWGRRIADGTHLRPNGEWLPTLTSFDPPTPREQVAAEIARMRAEADRLDADEAHDSSDPHIETLRQEARGMERALAMLAAAETAQ